MLPGAIARRRAITLAPSGRATPSATDERPTPARPLRVKSLRPAVAGVIGAFPVVDRVIQRNSLARHLDGVGVKELMRGEPTPHSRLDGETAQLRARSRLRPRSPAGRAVDDAGQRPCWQLEPLRGPGVEVFPAPVVHPDLAAAAALAAAHQERAAARVEVALEQIERLLDPETGAPENHDQPRIRSPATPSPATRMTATISSTRGGSAG